MSRLGFILLMLSLVGCTSSGPTRPSYPIDEMKARKYERDRRKKTGYKRRYKSPK